MKKKNLLPTLPCLALILFTAGCGFDNFDAPDATITGRVTYHGEPICVSTSEGHHTELYLYQDGYQLNEPLQVYVDQDGSFNVKIFDGNYKLTTRQGYGPWKDRTDTLKFTLNGHHDIGNFEVTPYFTISNADITMSGNTINATFSIQQVVSEAALDKVTLYFSNRAIIDEGFFLKSVDMPIPATGSVSLSMDVSDISAINSQASPHLFARVGVKSNLSSYSIFSPVIQLK